MLKRTAITIFLISGYKGEEQEAQQQSENSNPQRPPSLWRTILNNRTINEITSNVDTVKYTDLQQAFEILLTGASSSRTTEDFLDYGCWCSRVTQLVAASSAEKSEAGHKREANDGGFPLDRIDMACHDWNKCMRCVTLEARSHHQDGPNSDPVKNRITSGRCKSDEAKFSIGVKSNGELTCQDPINYVRPCAYESCSCSLHLIEQLTSFAEQWTWENSKSGDKKCKKVTKKVKNHEKVGLEDSSPDVRESEMVGRSAGSSGSDSKSNSVSNSESNSASNSVDSETSDSLGGGFLLLDDFGGSESYTSKNGGETDTFYELDDDEADDDSDDWDALESLVPPMKQRSRGSKVVHQCCGTVPHWRPFKPSTKKCCSNGNLMGLTGQCDNG